jgi:hypothetical protein
MKNLVLRLIVGLNCLFSFSLLGTNIYVKPGNSINDAINQANAGDVVILKDGRYFQTITINKAITLKAEHPGMTIIDGGGDLKFTWTKVGEDWSTQVAWNPQHIVIDNLSLIRMGDKLKNYVGSGIFSGGFYYTNGSVFVRPGKDIDPNTLQVSIQRENAGTGILINSSNVSIEGLIIQCHALFAIKLSDISTDCIIRNCFIIGSRQGIVQNPGKGKGHLIEYNEITNYPLYQRSRHTYDLWDIIYQNKPASGDGIFDSETTGISIGAKSSIVRYNVCSEMMDGMQPRKQGSTLENEKMEWYNNLVYNCRDDGVEFDSNDALRMRFHHNIIINALANIAPSPVMVGPVTIDHNLVLATPFSDGGIKDKSVLFKLDADNSWTDGYARKTRIIHNTVVSTNPVTGLWWTQPDIGQEDCLIANNIIDTQKELTRAFPYTESNNFRSNNVNFVRKGIKWDLRLQFSSAALDFGDPSNSDNHTYTDGKPDAGAIEYGQNWDFPLIGPQWKTHPTSPLPVVVDLKMVGMNKSTDPEVALMISKPEPNSVFAEKMPISITADVYSNSISIQKVEFFQGNTKIGEATSTPYSIVWENAPAGSFTIIAKVTDEKGGVITSEGINIVVEQKSDSKEVLLVVGSSNLNSGDQAIKSKLENLGYVVTVKWAGSALSTDAVGKSFVYVSSTVNSADVGSKFRDTSKGVIVCESYIQDDMNMTGLISGTDFGVASSQSQITVSAVSHPLSTGVSTGKISVYLSVDNLNWGVPSKEAIIITTLADDLNKATFYAYEKGSNMVGYVAPGRRVGFF